MDARWSMGRDCFREPDLDRLPVAHRHRHIDHTHQDTNVLGENMAKNIVGIDISSSGIRAVEVSDATRDRPTVERFRAATLPEGAVINGEVIEPRTVATALKQLWT